MLYLIFILIIFSSSWTWKILQFNPFVFILVFFCSLALLRKVSGKKINRFVVISFFVILLFLQYRTTNINSLTKLDDVQKTVQIMRMRMYPHPRIAHIIEERPEFIAFFRVEKNMFDALDPNLYFFANHPRSRVGFDEFEKFSYLLLPFFALGIFQLINKGELKNMMAAFLAPLLLISFIGHQNPIGPFSLMPFLGVTITVGIYYAIYRK